MKRIQDKLYYSETELINSKIATRRQLIRLTAHNKVDVKFAGTVTTKTTDNGVNFNTHGERYYSFK